MQSEVADRLARSSKAAGLLQSLVRDPWWRARGQYLLAVILSKRRHQGSQVMTLTRWWELRMKRGSRINLGLHDVDPGVRSKVCRDALRDARADALPPRHLAGPTCFHTMRRGRCVKCGWRWFHD